MLTDIAVDVYVKGDRIYISIGPETHYRSLSDMQRQVDESSIPVEVLFWDVYRKLDTAKVDLADQAAVATAVAAEPLRWTAAPPPVKAADSGNGGLVSILEHTDTEVIGG